MKKHIGFISLTACEGCQFAILDLGEKFLELAKRIDVVDMRLIREAPKIIKEFEILFVEGNPTLDIHFKTLRKARFKTKKLIVLGNCAHLGGVWEIKNYHNKNKIVKSIYKNYKRITNKDIKSVPELVKIDGFIPGCPIDGNEFLQVTYNLLENQETMIPERPVCYECQLQEFECLLQKGQPCFGPITLGGCNAICLNSSQPCWACRGLLRNVSQDTVKSLLKEMKKNYKDEEIKMLMEVFGVRDSIEALSTNPH